MGLRLVQVVGGGPAGLFAARLLKLARPEWSVRLYERLPAERTFGFGVGLTGRTLAQVRAADPEVADDLVSAAWPFSTAEFLLPHGTTAFHSGVAIGRATKLRLLARRAEDAGLKVELGTAPPVSELTAEADLVMAADGVGSRVRGELADRLGAHVEVGRGNFFWCGSEVPLDGAVFMSVRTDHGVFTAHAYPYARDRSTFVIEASDTTLHRAGLDASSLAADGATDEISLAYLSEAFAPLLGGVPFLGNRSRWTHFRTVRCARWSADSVVLLGDAAATAHPTIGSGTKLALESVIALATALHATDDVADALFAYERGRRPTLERLQALATRSQLWWESFECRLGVELAVDSGNAWDPAGDRLLATAIRLARDGAAVVRLTGGADPEQIRDRLAVGERLRREAGVLVQVSGPRSSLGELADGLVAGRADIICLADEEAAHD
jgi:anthraniloyl-CoA monooxygenase